MLESFSYNFPRLLFFCCVFILYLPACATVQSVQDSMDISLTEQPKFYVDQRVNKIPPEVFIQPKERALNAPKVLFVPFRVTQTMNQPLIAAYSISRAFYQTWNAMRLFPVMEFSADETPYRRDYSLQLAKKRGADMLLSGFITHVYAGGSVGASQLAVQIEALDVHSGQTVWSMAQTGSMPAVQEKDYIVFVSKTRLPADPLNVIAKSMAVDMGALFQEWLRGATPSSTLQRFDQNIRDTLFPREGSIPQPNRTDGLELEQDSF